VAFLLAGPLTMAAVTWLAREFRTFKTLGWRSRRIIRQVKGAWPPSVSSALQDAPSGPTTPAPVWRSKAMGSGNRAGAVLMSLS